MADAPRRLAAAFDVGGTKTAMAIVDEGGRIVHRAEAATGHGHAAERTVEAMRLFAMRARSSSPIAGIGVGMAAQINPASGRIEGSDDNLEGWARLDLRGELGGDPGLPVVVENDANVAAIGEGWVGAAIGARDFICVTLGTGVGSGIVCDGRILTGAWGGAAELGHLPVRRGAPPCYCGGVGCLEMLVSGPGLLARAHASGYEATRPSDLFDAARRGDPRARSILDEAVEDLNVAVITLVNVFQPELLVFGGGLARPAAPSWLPAVRHAIDSMALPNNRRVRLELARLGNDAGLLGAARLALIGG